MIAHAYIYDREGRLLLVCPAYDTLRWWYQRCVLRVEVRHAPTSGS